MIKKATSPLLELTTTSSYASLQKAVAGRCKDRSREGNLGLEFAIFETSPKDKGLDSGDWIVKHPDIFDEGAVFEGKCVFYSDYWRVSDDEVSSEVMENPSWREILNECNRQLIDPNDGSTACLFLEGFTEMEPKDGVRVFEIDWGS